MILPGKSKESKMSNSTVGNPWVLDTAGVISTAPIKVEKFVCTPTTDGHDILIQDNGGNTVHAAI